jgi:hypothetical protein
LDDFARILLYRERASEFELLAETEASPDVRLRYRIVARHYREREEQADKARFAERMERARLQRQQAAAKGTLPASLVAGDGGAPSTSSREDFAPAGLVAIPIARAISSLVAAGSGRYCS